MSKIAYLGKKNLSFYSFLRYDKYQSHQPFSRCLDISSLLRDLLTFAICFCSFLTCISFFNANAGLSSASRKRKLPYVLMP